MTEAAALAQMFETETLETLMMRAAALRDSGHGIIQTYSPKVFIPLTQLCRDACGYCTFAHPPRRGEAAFMTRDEVLAVARAGAAAGCAEALFTLGDKPELRYLSVRDELVRLGHETTLSYLAEMCSLVAEETGLLPHVNAGVMGAEDLAMLRRVSVSQGLMLEGVAPALAERVGPHYGSPDKLPERRLETIRLAGTLSIPFTSGILIGIGETRTDRIAALLALRDLHREHGHIQEIIIQNFRAKPGTRMAGVPEPTLDDLLWTIAVARLLFGPAMTIQAPPNLTPESYPMLIAAGINDWGGVSPVTPDHVNPEAPWPHLAELRARTAAGGKRLVARLPVHSPYMADVVRWQDARMIGPVLKQSDAEGLLRDTKWAPGREMAVPQIAFVDDIKDKAITAALDALSAGHAPDEAMIVRLFSARGSDVERICQRADLLRRRTVGNEVTYVVNRNINYTNICIYSCRFCAFSKGRGHQALRGKPYLLDLEEIGRRVAEAWQRGATEVCMQGGIHPSYDGNTYLSIVEAAKQACPDMHVHAFSPLEVTQGARTLGLAPAVFLARLRKAGLGSLPGTAAEILDDGVRARLCPGKLSTDEWLSLVEDAHLVGLRTTATIMFGHIEQPLHWARHLLRIRAVQARTGGFTEFVPLPFVHMEAPMYLKGQSRRGPTFREVLLMHAIARLVLHPLIINIQASWVKLGNAGIRACLTAGVNDLGGSLMDESISRAAGASFGQEMTPDAMERLIGSVGRVPRRRTTLYGAFPAEEEPVAS
ncbi:5-amino-6-(D-ribitylamino)uracil--L-tyrosine 4-hydroxyphenyl transferase CofH [Sphingobium aquiterrae]|uniref:5-amino-6-(D-ribitylamino)uracil--L-tyrosine 4-hydroxyphenyl transferase CofH n=1 Tax=Sphingobium aquiterrae TaxID=2038656 RepID=UPI0030171E8E